MTKKQALSLAAMPIVFCCLSISPSGALDQPAVLLRTEAQKPEGDLSRAAALFREGRYSEALPILERLANANPSDDQAIFGLGVALIYAADSETDFEKRKRLVIRARQTLIRAKDLGVDGSFLNWELKYLSADGDDSKTGMVATIAIQWQLHPPMVFDSSPPEAIKLPEGYRHKVSTNFEGLTAGTIWKKGGLKIDYEFAYATGGGAAVREIEESEQVWRRKTRSEDLEFEYALKKDNHLIISSYHQGHKFADFFVKVSGEQDVEEVLSIIKGLKPRRRR